MSDQRLANHGKAIEVAALLGDSVVDVKHCMDPRGGRITPRTWTMIAVGVLCVLVSGVAFYLSVTTAAHNASALDAWTRLAGKPAHAFRPELLGAGYDWLAFGGFAAGLCALAGGLSRARREQQSPYYRIGTAPGVEQPVEHAPAASFPLVAPEGDGFVFNFGAGISGELAVDGGALTFAELAAAGRARPSMMAPGAFELPIPSEGRIRARVGQTSFVIAAVERPHRHAAPLLAGLESRVTSYFAGSLAAHLALVLLLSHIPVEAGSAALDLAPPQEILSIRTDGTEKTDVPPESTAATTGIDGGESGGVAMSLPAGQAGTTRSTNADGRMQIKDNQLDPQLAREQAIEEARQRGLLGSTSLQSGDAFAWVDSTEALASGFAEAHVYGAMFGSAGESQGLFGFARRGAGDGGGCVSDCGTIGTPDGYGVLGVGRYARSGWAGPGGGGPGMRRRTASVPQPVFGTPTSPGDLDRALIRRYIKQHVEKIAFCYEKQLLATPGLAGTTVVSFFIMPSGRVGSAVASGFDATVGNCVADVISAIEFPRPSGGGGVQVNYPFTFHAAGT